MVKRRSTPVDCSRLAAWLLGAARHTVMPSSLARRWVLISTFSPARSHRRTRDRSRISSRVP